MKTVAPVGDRIAALDGLRAFAVGLVLLGHAFPSIYPRGGVGVDVFFVISGFVITRHLLDNQPSFKSFYVARIQRLLPPALVVIAATWALFQMKLVETSYLAILAAAFSFMNWLRAFEYFDDDGGRLGLYWSLSIEEQFYALWPILLLLLLHYRHDPRKVILAAIIAVMAWRIFLYLNGASPERISNGLDTRADGLLAGCLLAFIKPRDVGLAAPIAIGVIFFAGALYVDPSSLFTQLRYPLITGLSVFAVLGCVWGTGRWKIALENPMSQWLGSRSYSVYLWHYPLMGAASTIGIANGVRGAIYMSVATALALIAAEITFRTIERPLREARHRKLNS
ncbi:MAG: acyltransferase [Erythrobacter sp.]